MKLPQRIYAKIIYDQSSSSIKGINMSRYTLLLAVVALAVISFCHAKDQPPVAAQLKKDYGKINDYLVKNVHSEDPEQNMAKIEELLLSEQNSLQRKLFGDNSMVTTLKKLSALTKLPLDEKFCRSKEEPLMKELDSGLEDESRSTNREYSLTRVNKIIEHYTFNNMFMCSYIKKMELNYALKQVDYDQINRYLVESLPEEQDIEVNMAKAEELLNSLSSREGALAKALEQFLELRLLLSEETCGKQGYQILYKNDLGTRGKAYEWFYDPVRRIDKIFRSYAQAHEALCIPVLRQAYGQEVKRLDAETYHKVLGMIVAQYLSDEHYGQLVEDLKQKQVDENFTLPPFVGFIKNEAKEADLCPKISPRIFNADPSRLYRLAKAMSADGPDQKYFYSYLDEISGKRVVNEEKLYSLLDHYFFIPCKHYVDALGGIIGIDDYYSGLSGKHLFSRKGKFSEDLSYNMIRMAHEVCRFTKSRQKELFAKIKKEAFVNHH